MTSRGEAGRRIRNDSGELVDDIATIGKALYSEKKGKEDKKKNWWRLAIPGGARSKRYNCCFTLQVPKIEGLPSEFNGSSLYVHWERTTLSDGARRIGPAEVVEGVAEFDEQLAHTCLIDATRNSFRHSAKYSARQFRLYVTKGDQLGFNLGKHSIDVAKLLPDTFEELEGEKSWGKWTTSYTLQGEAAGAVMNVCYGYVLLGDNPSMPPNSKTVLERLGSNKSKVHGRLSSVSRTESLPQDKRIFDHVPTRSVDDIRVLHEVLPATSTDLSDSLNQLDMMLDPSFNVEPGIGVSVDQSEHAELSFRRTDSFKENVVCGDADISSVLENSNEEKTRIPYNKLTTATDDSKVDRNSVQKDACIKESILEELESALNDVADLEKEGLDSPQAESESGDPDNYGEANTKNVDMPLSLEDLESAEKEFLSLFGGEDGSVDFMCETDTKSPRECLLEDQDSPIDFTCESDPESPRERLLRDFERDAVINGYPLFGNFAEEEEEEEEEEEYIAPRIREMDSVSDYFVMPSTLEPSAETLELRVEYDDVIHSGTSDANQAAGWRPAAKISEELELEALMQELGMNKKNFESSQPDCTADMGSSSELTHQAPHMLPDLGEGLGSLVQTKNGGFLRSMNPDLFRNSKSGGRLIMQVSSPVVVPAEMGPGVTEVLENLASLGLERLSAQASKLMPLEDVTGQTIGQLSWEATPQLESNDRQHLLQRESDPGSAASGGHKKSKRRSSRSKSRASNSSTAEYVNLEDLAPLAMDKIEAVSIEGLKIQSGMSEEEVFSSIGPKSLGVEGAVGLQLLNVKDNSAAVDGLMGMSLTLNEWMRMDSGEINEDEMKNERTSKILAAHHASSTDLTILGRRGDRKTSKGHSGKCGLFGNDFTVALMVQLRDPLRDYEPVGMPMLALIQVERVFVPPKPKIYNSVCESKQNNEDDDEDEDEDQKTVKTPELGSEEDKTKLQDEDLIPQFKVAEVHVAGLKTDLEGKKLWGSATQQKSGSRWLVANGMGKAKSKPFMKNKAGGAATVGKSSSKPTTFWLV